VGQFSFGTNNLNKSMRRKVHANLRNGLGLTPINNMADAGSMLIFQ
jgi:hypothetical protein